MTADRPRVSASDIAFEQFIKLLESRKTVRFIQGLLLLLLGTLLLPIGLAVAGIPAILLGACFLFYSLIPGRQAKESEAPTALDAPRADTTKELPAARFPTGVASVIEQTTELLEDRLGAETREGTEPKKQ